MLFIDCLQNRIDEIPFESMGKMKNHRKIPILFAANSVNYGRPSKLNTAEALSASLYICGFKSEASVILEPFGYGKEFIRLNFDALEAYSRCQNSIEVEAVQQGFIEQDMRKQEQREEKKESGRETNGKITASYLDDSDLPPMHSSDDEYEEEVCDADS